MSSLKFVYGCVNSSKTANLLILLHSLNREHKIALVAKPSLDTFSTKIVSRVGLSKTPDFEIVGDDTSYNKLINKNIHYLIIDEAQFLSSLQIDNLRFLATKIDVICFGLKNDFMMNLFEGSRRLFELSDILEEMSTPCHYCREKGSVNVKHCNGIIITSGQSIEIGKEELYIPACYTCYYKKVEEQSKLEVKVQKIEIGEAVTEHILINKSL